MRELWCFNDSLLCICSNLVMSIRLLMGSDLTLLALIL